MANNYTAFLLGSNEFRCILVVFRLLSGKEWQFICRVLVNVTKINRVFSLMSISTWNYKFLFVLSPCRWCIKFIHTLSDWLVPSCLCSLRIGIIILKASSPVSIHFRLSIALPLRSYHLIRWEFSLTFIKIATFVETAIPRLLLLGLWLLVLVGSLNDVGILSGWRSVLYALYYQGKSV